MPAETGPLDDYSDSPAYRWTIRTLYVVLIGANIYLLWSQTDRGGVEGAVIRARVREIVEQVKRPFVVQREWKRGINPMHFEAEQIIDAASAGGEA